MTDKKPDDKKPDDKKPEANPDAVKREPEANPDAVKRERAPVKDFRVTHWLQRIDGRVPANGAVALMCIEDEGDGTGEFVSENGRRIVVKRDDAFRVDTSVNPPRVERNQNAPMIVRA